MKTITFTPDRKVKIEEPTVVFEGSMDELIAERAAIDERIGDYDGQVAEMEAVRAKLIAERDEKDALLASVEVQATAERVDLTETSPK